MITQVLAFIGFVWVTGSAALALWFLVSAIVAWIQLYRRGSDAP